MIWSIIRGRYSLWFCNESWDDIHVLDYCVMYAKYFIYAQRLYNNNVLHLFACLVHLQKALYNICNGNTQNTLINLTLSMKTCTIWYFEITVSNLENRDKVFLKPCCVSVLICRSLIPMRQGIKTLRETFSIFQIQDFHFI